MIKFLLLQYIEVYVKGRTYHYIVIIISAFIIYYLGACQTPTYLHFMYTTVAICYCIYILPYNIVVFLTYFDIVFVLIRT